MKPFFLPLCAIIYMQTFPALAETNDFTTWKPTALYDYASDLLRHGRNYNDAIAASAEAVKRDPNNLDYQLVLGSACASRLASMAYAMRRTELQSVEKTAYEIRLRVWEQTHTIPSCPLFNSRPPQLPAQAYTPDDRKPFALSPPEARLQLTKLARKSLAAFRRAQSLTDRASPEHRAEAHYLRGWGLFLLRRFGPTVVHLQDAPSPSETTSSAQDVKRTDDLLLRQEDIIECFRACAQHDPKNAAYWQSLALALVPTSLDDVLVANARYLNRQALGNQDRTDEAIAALKHGIEMRPRDPDLLYQLALIYAPTKPTEALAALNRLASTAGTNAVIWYLLAEQSLRQAATLHVADAESLQAKALQAIEAGNQSPGYAAVQIIVPIPPELAKPWNYIRPYGLGIDSRLCSYLFSYLGDVASQQKDKGDTTGVLRVALAMMRLGHKAIAHYNGADLDRADPMTLRNLNARALMGVVNCEKAYAYMKAAEALSPTGEISALVAANDAAIQLAKAWDKALTQ